MLQEVLEYIHNYFIKTPLSASFVIKDGAISPLPSLEEGQRFLIVGSDLNDGVYTYRTDGVQDDDDTSAAGLAEESFDGTICTMAVPPSVIAISQEMSEWAETYTEQLNSPLQSESFNGYSYSMRDGASSTGGSGQLTWRDVFGKRLERWRKPCV